MNPGQAVNVQWDSIPPTWTEALALGLASYARLVNDPKLGAAFDGADYIVRSFLDRFVLRRSVFSTLPLTTLHLLSQTLKARPILLEAADIHRQPAEMVALTIAELTTGQRRRPSPLACAQIWAYHAMLGHGGPKHLLDLGLELYGTTWSKLQQDSGFSTRMDLQLDALRDRGASTETHCRAISEIGRLLQVVDGIPQILNCLLHHQFVWPLLVLQQSVPGDAGIAISLPVSVDLVRDGLSRTTIRPESSILGLDGWRDHLIRSVTAAKELWRSKHGGHRNSREMVMGASASFGFEVADTVVRKISEIGYRRLEIDDGSADGYFAQVVLNRILGRSRIFASVATGSIGQHITSNGKPTLNRVFEAPGGVESKLKYAFASGNQFERIVIPSGSNRPEYTIRTRAANAELLKAGNLETMADIMQVDGWRQTAYISCPDVAWAVHSQRLQRPDLLPLADPNVQRTLKALRENRASPVLHVHQVSGVEIASALWHLNTTMREKVSSQHRPPTMSWCFIRARRWESDLRFWHVLYKAIGASDRLFPLLTASTVAESADLIARELNVLEPTLDRLGQSAPDVIVLLNSQVLAESEYAASRVLFRPQHVPRVLDELAGSNLLAGHSNDYWRTCLGNTRILVVPDETMGRLGDPTFLTPTAEELLSLRALSTFEWGFTAQTGWLTLVNSGQTPDDFRQRILKPLMAKRLVREGQGKYHVVPAIRSKLPQESEAEQAERHFRAGCALSPDASRLTGGTIALDIAFRPEHVHESQEHLRRALQFAKRATLREVSHRIGTVFDRVTRYHGLPSWPLVANVLQRRDRSSYGFALAMELLRVERRLGKATHPSNLRLTARAAAATAAGIPKEDPEKERYLNEAEHYFAESLAGCPRFPDAAANEVSTLTAYASHLMEQGHYDRAADLSSRAFQLLAQGVPRRVTLARWWELLSDREDDHAKAITILRKGQMAAPRWIQLWIKGIGAAALMDRSKLVERMKKQFRTVIAESEQRVWDPWDKAVQAFGFELVSPKRHTLDRMIAGWGLLAGHDLEVSRIAYRLVEITDNAEDSRDVARLINRATAQLRMGLAKQARAQWHTPSQAGTP
jgi:hypothetical protein